MILDHHLRTFNLSPNLSGTEDAKSDTSSVAGPRARVSILLLLVISSIK